MVERQSYFENTNPGKDLDIEHNVYNIIYLVEIFYELYPEEFIVKRGKRGRPIEYSPKELLTLILWGKNNSKESCRNLEKWDENKDQTYKLILNCKKPSKTTINNFKNEYSTIIDKFDQFLIDFGMALGLIEGKILYADGTILKAWCNTFKKMYPYEIKYLKEFIQSNVSNKELWNKLKRHFLNNEEDEKLKEELQDQLDEFQYNLNSTGIYLLKLSLKSSKNFKKILERIEQMEDNISGEHSISIIDPEARHMPDKKGNMGLNYNYQTVTDEKYGFRIAHYITNNPNDEKEVKKLVDITTQRIHTDEFILCVDNGYWSPELLKKIYEGNTKVVIPDSSDASRKKNKIKNKNKSGKRQEIINQQKQQENNKRNKPKRIKKHEFKYIGKIDAFECPKTKKLLNVVKIVGEKGKQKKKYANEYCITCEFKAECTSQHSRVFYEHYDKNLEEIRRLYYSDEGQKIYSKRGHYAETSFAVLLEIRNFRGIKTRGLENVNNELTICEIHNNIKKYEKHTTNKLLKLILNIIKQDKKENGKTDFTLIEELKEKLIIRNGVIRGINHKK